MIAASSPYRADGEQAGAGDREQGGQGRHGAQDGYGHGKGGGRAHNGEEGNPGDREGQERDDDGHTRERDGRARSRDGAGGRLGGRQPGGQVLAVAGDDEQRVVDPDRESDHQREQGRRA